jgi:hypothetical protein
VLTHIVSPSSFNGEIGADTSHARRVVAVAEVIVVSAIHTGQRGALIILAQFAIAPNSLWFLAIDFVIGKRKLLVAEVATYIKAQIMPCSLRK